MATLIASVLIHRSLYDVSCCVVRCGPRCKGLCLALFCRWRQARWRSIKVPAPEVILSSTSNPSQQILHRIHSSVFHPDLSLSQYSPLPFSLLIFHPHQFSSSHSSIMVRPQQKKPRCISLFDPRFYLWTGCHHRTHLSWRWQDFPPEGRWGFRIASDHSRQTPDPFPDTVVIHYVGTLADGGKKFDSSRDRYLSSYFDGVTRPHSDHAHRGDPFRTKIGVGKVIKGWDEGKLLSIRLIDP